MDVATYKRHLLNHMYYSHAYFLESGEEDTQANRVALCEAATHAIGCAWCIADYHREANTPDTTAADAWELIANRWIKAIEKWHKGLPANRAAAYAAPIRERKALAQWPTAAVATGIPTTKGTRSLDATPTRASGTGASAIAGASPVPSSTAESDGTDAAPAAADPELDRVEW